MGIRYTKNCAFLEGDVPADDAEALSAWLKERRHPGVGLQDAGHLHAAVLQVLLALRPTLKSEPAGRWLRCALGLPGQPATTGENA